MRIPPLVASMALTLLIASSSSPVTMAWTPIGNPGNACDPQPGSNGAPAGCFGSVGYAYDIGTYEVTNAQYVEFLNAKAAADPLGLYSSFMSNVPAYGGIARNGTSGSYSYTAIVGREQMPVNYVSWFDAVRFANWMNNGQGIGDTETGSYTLLGGTATPSNALTITRNGSATIFLASEDEWYKAAYYDALSTSYFDYPAGTSVQTVCSTPTATANRANCDLKLTTATDRGSYTGSPSPSGTFDQGGNVWEWNESLISGTLRGVRGGAFNSSPGNLSAGVRGTNAPINEVAVVGFRVSLIPEPGTGLLVMMGVLGIGFWRRSNA